LIVNIYLSLSSDIQANHSKTPTQQSPVKKRSNSKPASKIADIDKDMTLYDRQQSQLRSKAKRILAPFVTKKRKSIQKKQKTAQCNAKFCTLVFSDPAQTIEQIQNMSQK